MSDYTYIEAYDPGEATGYTFGYFSETEGFTMVSAQTLTREEVFAKMADEWPQVPGRIRVVESFRLRASNNFSANLIGKEIIGAMKFAEYIYDMDTINWQTRGDKALIPDHVLKEHGLWKTPTDVGWNTGRHVNDATIHILAYLHKHEHLPTLQRYGLL